MSYKKIKLFFCVVVVVVVVHRNHMLWCGVVKGQDTVNKVVYGVWQQSVFTCSAADSFQHTQNHHAHA